MTHAADPGFVHLHLHTQYSLLDGAIRMDELAPTIVAQGMDSVAVTDHGNLFGAVHFQKQAKRHGIKPIFGCEAYVASRGRFDKSCRDSAHLVLLAKNHTGYNNLRYLISMGYLEGFYYNPRIDLDLLRQHSEGLFGLSACLGGVVNKVLREQGEGKAAQVAQTYAEIFEKDHFFLEIQSNGLPEQERANQALISIARTYNIPLVATADAHYLRPEDSSAHEVLMCIGQGRSLQDFRQKSYHSDKLYVTSPQEMWDCLGGLAPDALENTVRIAKQCNVELQLGETFLPTYQIPQGYTLDSYLAHLAYQGLKQRQQASHYTMSPSTYEARLDYELGVITTMGFASYFLIVWDFIRYAKQQGIPVGPGRGSGAGSLVAYCLAITDLDPIPFDLLFERFLNPERISMPDFDIDFCQDRRNEVIRYVSDKYGTNNVGQIVTYSQLSAKSVIKDVGRVMALPFAEVNELTKLIPGLINGKKVSIAQALTLEPKLIAIQQEKPIYKEVIQIAQALEGLNRQTGMHAAGIVIGDKPLWDYVPVCRGKEGEIVTQFAKDEVEEAGLVKFDFLGLKTLTVIANAQTLIRKRPGQGPMGPNADFDVSQAPLTDSQVYRLLSQANTDGVFQLESSGFKELLKRLKPDNFEDIVAAVALYRPGPLDAGMVEDYIQRKHNKKQVTYPHPACQEILQTTYGVIVYQEQVMRIAVALCGFSMAEADILRKAMGKKKADVMAQLRQSFIDGAKQHGNMPEGEAGELFSQIEKFAGYAFNKSHSAAYAVISYQTAYLKAYYPLEFTAALLSTEMRDRDTVVRYIQSAREAGMAILPPSLNVSMRDFSVRYSSESAQTPQEKAQGTKSQEGIVFGLGAVKGMGDAIIDNIMQARAQGPFTDLYDFCTRMGGRKLNRKSLEALIASGACDDFGQERSVLLAAMDGALEYGQRQARDLASGQQSLFDLFDSAPGQPSGQSQEQARYPQVPPLTNKEQLAKEKAALGFYITGHPLDAYIGQLERLGCCSTSQLPQLLKGKSYHEEVALAGIVTQLKERPLRSGQGRMAFALLEDLHGSCELLIFSKPFAAYEHLLKADVPLLVRGVPMLEGDEEEGTTIKCRVQSIETLSNAQRNQTQGIRLHLASTQCNKQLFEQLKQIIKQYRGPTPVRMTIKEPQAFACSMRLGEQFSIDPNEDCVARLGQLVGQQAIEFM